MDDNQVRVTIWDAQGNVVVDELCRAQTATQEQIDDMVALIEAGNPAWLASQIAMLPRASR